LFTRNGGVWERKVLTPNTDVEAPNSKTTPETTTEESWKDGLRSGLAMIQCRLPYSINVYFSMG
jgi:hypothetical protein